MRILILALILLLAGLGAAAFLVRSDGGGEGVRGGLSVAEAMAGDTTGYARADAVRALVFPEDYGPHPDFKTEWWYYTGNLEAEGGRHFGYEFTIFRFAVAPADSTPARASTWGTNQLYMAHFALTDVAGEAFYAFERFSRGAAGLAGAQADPYRVWLEDWSVEGPAGEAFPMRLRAAAEGVALDLILETGKPVVLQGEQGLDRKGPEPGNASYYYSFTRLPTRGTVRLGDDEYAVRGRSWKDHEWSTSALGADLSGWDWFALQLDDGRDLMFYQLRRRDGTASGYTTGTLVAPDGTATPLDAGAVRLDVLETWESPRGGTYPARWRLRVPSEALDLTVTPFLADQELDVSVRYWEGAVRVDGTAAGSPATGTGYVELTGYADAPPGSDAHPRGPALP